MREVILTITSHFFLTVNPKLTSISLIISTVFDHDFNFEFLLELRDEFANEGAKDLSSVAIHQVLLKGIFLIT